MKCVNLEIAPGWETPLPPRPSNCRTRERRGEGGRVMRIGDSKTTESTCADTPIVCLFLFDLHIYCASLLYHCSMYYILHGLYCLLMVLYSLWMFHFPKVPTKGINKVLLYSRFNALMSSHHECVGGRWRRKNLMSKILNMWFNRYWSNTWENKGILST